MKSERAQNTLDLPHSTDSSEPSPQSSSWSQTNRRGMQALLWQRKELSSHVLLGAEMHEHKEARVTLPSESAGVFVVMVTESWPFITKPFGFKGPH